MTPPSTLPVSRSNTAYSRGGAHIRLSVRSLARYLPITAPEDIAEFAVFLASDRARYMTGGVHVVDSGYTCFKGGMDTRAVVATE